MPKGIPIKGSRRVHTRKSKYIGKITKGQTFGYWTVVDDTLKTVSQDAAVLVSCVCGTIKLQPCRRLLNGDTKSCSCMRSANKSVHWKGTENISGRYIRAMSFSAKRRNLMWELDNEYLQSLLELQNYKCALSGWDIVFAKNRTLPQTASLDRIDSAKGYVKGNVQWVHKYINLSKNVFSNVEYIQLCKRVYDYNRDRISEDDFQLQVGAIGIYGATGIAT